MFHNALSCLRWFRSWFFGCTLLFLRHWLLKGIDASILHILEDWAVLDYTDTVLWTQSIGCSESVWLFTDVPVLRCLTANACTDLCCAFKAISVFLHRKLFNPPRYNQFRQIPHSFYHFLCHTQESTGLMFAFGGDQIRSSLKHKCLVILRINSSVSWGFTSSCGHKMLLSSDGNLLPYAPVSIWNLDFN